MNLEHSLISDKQILNDLIDGKAFIAFFVNEEQYYWIIDWDEHFNLDYQKNIEAICNNPNLTRHLPTGMDVKKYRSNLYENYRGGITSLTSQSFGGYLKQPETINVSNESLSEALLFDELGNFSEIYKRMESYLSFGKPELTEMDYNYLYKLRTLLPSFYINFDRKILMHMRKERFYENSVYEDWYGVAGDFEHLIPISYRYWSTNRKVDYWSINNFQNL